MSEPFDSKNTEDIIDGLQKPAWKVKPMSEREDGKNLAEERKEGVCPECKGEGSFSEFGDSGLSIGCPECKGTGKVPVEGVETKEPEVDELTFTPEGEKLLKALIKEPEGKKENVKEQLKKVGKEISEMADFTFSCPDKPGAGEVVRILDNFRHSIACRKDEEGACYGRDDRGVHTCECSNCIDFKEIVKQIDSLIESAKREAVKTERERIVKLIEDSAKPQFLSDKEGGLGLIKQIAWCDGRNELRKELILKIKDIEEVGE